MDREDRSLREGVSSPTRRDILRSTAVGAVTPVVAAAGCVSSSAPTLGRELDRRRSDGRPDAPSRVLASDPGESVSADAVETVREATLRTHSTRERGLIGENPAGGNDRLLAYGLRLEGGAPVEYRYTIDSDAPSGAVETARERARDRLRRFERGAVSTGLVAESPWKTLGTIFHTAAAWEADEVVGEVEHNYHGTEVPAAAGTGDGTTAFALAAEVVLRPGRGGPFAGRFGNHEASIRQDWARSDHEYRELTCSPVGDDTTTYDTDLAVTVSTDGGRVGISVDGGRVRQHDESGAYPVDSTVHHRWGFPGLWACDGVRCRPVVVGNVGRVETEPPTADAVAFCPAELRAAFSNPDGRVAVVHTSLSPTLSDLDSYD
ncbi:hypothetical protein RYH80_04965 [Halobaculum sp. MBLA0147]|uniref:hypothetical protein n=1 Tax=Halobaculum sp. MBLA0147 TaxID=3079934 RepID=UPI003523CA96